MTLSQTKCNGGNKTEAAHTTRWKGSASSDFPPNYSIWHSLFSGFSACFSNFILKKFSAAVWIRASNTEDGAGGGASLSHLLCCFSAQKKKKIRATKI